MKTLSILLATVALATSAPAATILFDLFGNGGPGLLRTNEAPTVPPTGGSGGEVGPGISYDDVTNTLTINIAWGSGNGFTDLTSTVVGAHVHFPTPSLPPASFNEATGVMAGFNALPGFDNSPTDGGFGGTVTIPEEHEAGLLEGRAYINIHTDTHTGGEIRGNLIVIPEPSAIAFAALGALGLLARRQRG